MLLKYKNKIDVDGYLMLLLSVLVMFATAGISYFVCLRKIYFPAKNTKTNCQSNIILCVLGKKLLNDKPDTEYLLRLKRAIYILEMDDENEVVLLGGKTGDATISEAFAGEDVLLSNNIDRSRIFLEEESQNTLENMKNAIDVLSKNNKQIIVVTNRYHLARAKQLAAGLGLKVELCAAEDEMSMNLPTVFKLMIEALHLHWYSVGRRYGHITKNKRIIERIG